MLNPELRSQIDRFGQQHLLQFWDELTSEEQLGFAAELARVDWNLFSALPDDGVTPVQPDLGEDLPCISPPANVVRKPITAEELRTWKQARLAGEAALRQGKVAAVLLAGGQGTRLNFPHPKGMFPIGPVSGNSLFEIFAEQLLFLRDRYQHSIPYVIMTSDATHSETVSFFEQHDFFGLNPADVFFILQGYVPAVDRQTGKLLLAEKGSLNLNPDGHGGLLAALEKEGLLDELQRRGVDYLYTHQVDNPLVKICDPEFIGLHQLHNAEVSTKVVAKTGPSEKVGVAVEMNGSTQIIEYIDLPTSLASACDENGELQFWAGNTAIHLFNRNFLQRITRSAAGLPWHRAIKKVPYVNQQGQFIQPETENAIKLERFLFDTLPLASTALIVETLRDDEFAPLKNKDGDYSPEYVRQQMSRYTARWFQELGVTIPPAVHVEISPRYATSAEELAARRADWSVHSFDHSIHLSPKDGSQFRSPLPATITNQKLAASVDPLFFDTYYRPQIWGGQRLSTLLGRSLPHDGPFGEAWDISSLPLHVSEVTEGPHRGRNLNELWSIWRREGLKCNQAHGFPVLVKWLECQELLSVQVHPSDQMSQRLLQQPQGKSEVWVVVASEPTARIYAGLKPGITRDDLHAQMQAGRLVDCLHSFVPEVGDCIAIPAGTIHSAGGGLLVAEVQQASDATFRLYDWDRLGLDGKPRALQLDLALEAIDWNQGPVSPVRPVRIGPDVEGVVGEHLVNSVGFQLERYTVKQRWKSPFAGELTVWMVLDGVSELQNPLTGYRRSFVTGSTVVVPPNMTDALWINADSTRPLKLMCIHLHESPKTIVQ